MPGKRIIDPSLIHTNFDEAFQNQALALVDWTGLLEARPIPIKLLGNALIQGSETGAVYRNNLLPTDKYLRISVDGGTTWKILNIDNLDNLHPPVTIAAGSTDYLSIDEFQVLSINIPEHTDALPDTITSETENVDNGTTHTHKLRDVKAAHVLTTTSIKFGALYNWYAITDPRGITSAADNWVVPTATDYITLIDNMGGDSQAGGYSKEAGYEYWTAPNTGAINWFGLNMRGSGHRSYNNGDCSQLRSICVLGTREQSNDIWRTASLYNDNTTFTAWTTTLYPEGVALRLVRSATEAELLLADGTSCIPYVGNNLNIYPTVKIGSQVWTAYNLNETKYRNGDWIHGYEDGIYTPISDATWYTLTTEAMCYYDDIESYGGGIIPITQILHNPVTIASGSEDYLSIDNNQVLSFNPLIEDIAWDFNDVTAGIAQTYTLDIKVSFPYKILSVCLETDTGTLTGIEIRINSTAVTGLSGLTADTTVDETLATGGNITALNDRVWLVTSTGYTGLPIAIRGKLKIQRV